jgi:hypothetical protein
MLPLLNSHLQHWKVRFAEVFALRAPNPYRTGTGGNTNKGIHLELPWSAPLGAAATLQLCPEWRLPYPMGGLEHAGLHSGWQHRRSPQASVQPWQVQAPTRHPPPHHPLLLLP